ncbi:AAA family ATPase [Ligilactobacillus faecis]|uniref:AAA family ATPase n=1 Tax=Ligilactobacillus faecis TaxID=762833 RepID=UPI00246882FF|nr:AAA family ATPase [Ligilactobacillus faecis]WGN89805.1 AAA family ATPase [Ligilactobacillus faecis]
MQFFTPGNFPEHHNMYFIYGDGGTGKTSLLKQFKGNKALFSFDLSYNAVKDTGDITLAVLEGTDVPIIQRVVWDNLIAAINSPNIDVICLDNVTALQNYVLDNIENAARDNRQNYNAMQKWFREIGTLLRRSNKTIYATAHAIDKDNGGIDGKGRYEADMNLKTFNAFTSMFDLVGRIYLKDGERWIDLDPEQGNHAKNRIDDRKLIKADELIEPKPTEQIAVEEPKKKAKKAS